MAVEAKRGCGYRKAGGIYLVSGGVGEPCERLPVPIVTCDHCKRPGIEFTRSIQWIGVSYALSGARACAFTPDHCTRCVICQPVLMEREADPKDKFAIMWIGESHYATPLDWAKESNQLGVSRRLSAIPKEMVLGKSWVLVAHNSAITKKCETCKGLGYVGEAAKDADPCETCDGKGKIGTPGIFHAFRPHGYELVVTPSMKNQEWVKDLVKKHGDALKLVEVPEDDPDHAPDEPKKSARKRAMDKHARKMAPKKKEQEGKESGEEEGGEEAAE
jgi:hypothetical protein